MQNEADENEIVMQLEAVNEEKVTETAEAYEKEPETGAVDIYVYVCGAVNNPGVYPVKDGSRLFEVIEMAGGFTSEADRTCLNLARAAVDGEQIVILTEQEAADLASRGLYNVGAAGADADGGQENGLVNINTASAAELTTISGIGESRAQAIIAYRDENGSFKTIEEIKNVDGIKDGLFSKIKDKITV